MVGDGHAMNVAAARLRSIVMTIGSIRSRRTRTALLVVGVPSSYNSPPERCCQWPRVSDCVFRDPEKPVSEKPDGLSG